MIKSFSFGAQSMAFTYKQRQALKKMKVRLFRTDLRRFSQERLEQEFSTHKGNRIVKARLIRCVVFQAAVWMQRGKVPKVEGNLRSLFYQWIKPVIAKVPGGIDSRFDPYNEMLDVLEIFITKLHLFKYRDLDIVDGDWDTRWYSKGKNPHIIVFAEKDGFVRFLQEIHHKYDVTTLSLGGAPSHLSSEYLVEGLHKRFSTLEPFVLFAITDYDPSGLSIQQAFVSQLESNGLNIKETHSLIDPSQYASDELEIFSFKVPSKYAKRLENWMKQTKGINGKPFGLEADSMPKSQLRELLHQKILPFLKTP